MNDNGSIKIFGREPALFVAMIGAILMVLAGLNLEFLDTGAAVAITAVVTAVVLAITTRPIGPALFVGIWTALVALFAEYGLHMNEEMVVAVGAAILAVFAFVARQQVVPVDTAITRQESTGGLSVLSDGLHE
jgi:hypothetical protein